MPARNLATFDGLKIKVTPAFWLRRLTHFPFYFESHNPSFWCEVERIAESTCKATWCPRIVIRYPDGRWGQALPDSGIDYTQTLQIAEVKLGEKKRVYIPSVFTALRGQVTIVLQTTPDGSSTLDLYSYEVRAEEQLWLFPFGTLITMVITIAGTLFLQWLLKKLGY